MEYDEVRDYIIGKRSAEPILLEMLAHESMHGWIPKLHSRNRRGSENDEFGVLEVGMDKKGEIDNLTNIIKPNVGLITNINYAHAKNFKNIKQIALAKAAHQFSGSVSLAPPER